jgi:regulator of protease activity HflC (stomatin/prohibitin superfamily)
MCSNGCCCFECITTAEIGIIEKCGKWDRMAHPGPTLICWPFYTVAGRVSIRIQQLDVACETKTSDNVFVNVVISVQYAVQPEHVYEAFYVLNDPSEQIRSYVYDVVRSTLPNMTLDAAFESKEDIATEVKKELSEVMREYGFLIHNALVTDMAPDGRVKTAMNEINASKRLKEAAFEKAEGEKIILVKSAEAEAESKYLSGVGVARQRKAIVDGLRDSIAQFSSGVKGSTPKDVIDLLLLTQYFDMLKDVGQQAGTRAVFLPAKGKSQVGAVRDGLLQATAGARNIA